MSVSLSSVVLLLNEQNKEQLQLAGFSSSALSDSTEAAPSRRSFSYKLPHPASCLSQLLPPWAGVEGEVTVSWLILAPLRFWILWAPYGSQRGLEVGKTWALSLAKWLHQPLQPPSKSQFSQGLKWPLTSAPMAHRLKAAYSNSYSILCNSALTLGSIYVNSSHERFYFTFLSSSLSNWKHWSKTPI